MRFCADITDRAPIQQLSSMIIFGPCVSHKLSHASFLNVTKLPSLMPGVTRLFSLVEWCIDKCVPIESNGYVALTQRLNSFVINWEEASMGHQKAHGTPPLSEAPSYCARRRWTSGRDS